MITNINISELDARFDINCKRWMVIYSKSRREKKIAQYCCKRDVKFYLPIEKRMRIYGRKKVKTDVPLFPGYLFCMLDEKERYHLMLTHQIAKILNVTNQKELLYDIRKIFLVEKSGMILTACDSVIKGQKARIDFGPLRGMEGTIAEVRGKHRLFLEIEAIKQVASIEISRECVEILN